MLAQRFLDVANVRLPNVKVTAKTISFIKTHPTMHRGSMRTFMGEIYTDKEYFNLAKWVNKKRLPGYSKWRKNLGR